MQQLLQAMRQQKENSHHVVVTKEVSERINKLKFENESLKKEIQHKQTIVQELGAGTLMLEDKVRILAQEKEKLEAQSSRLLLANNQKAKVQYLEKQRQEMNETKQDLVKSQEEMVKLKKDRDSLKVKHGNTLAQLLRFFNNLCKVLGAGDAEKQIVIDQLQQEQVLEDLLKQMLCMVQDSTVAKTANQSCLNESGFDLMLSRKPPLPFKN